ncbi:MAG TPA: YfhO family protein [Thermoanaerobaculia bacterium]
MGLVLLVLLYLALAAALALPAWRWGGGAAGGGAPAGATGGGAAFGRRGVARWLLAPGGGVVSPAGALALTLLPVAFTWGAFLPGRTLAPTPMLAGVPPWSDAGRTAAVIAGSSPANPLLLDPTSQFIPWRQAARRDLLLNPSQAAGAALLANGQSAVLYPTEVLARRLPPFRAVGFSQAARLLVAAWGMFLLARALAASEPAALAAAVAWSGAGFVQLWRLHPHSLVAATLPWIVWAAVALARRPGPRPAVALAAAGALGVAAGHPETLLHGVLFAAAAAAVVLAVDPAGEGTGRASRRLPRIATWGTAAAALSALLAAPALLPFVDNLVVSTEWRHRSAAGTVVEVPFAESLVRLKPTFALRALGNPLAGTWTGPENLVELGGGAVGAGALLVAALAVVAARGRRRRWAAAILVVGLLGLAVSVHLVGVSKPFGAVPLLRESLLKRLSLWWALGAALAVAVGVDAWRERLAAWRGERGGLPGWWAAVGGAAATVAIAVAWAAGPPWRGSTAVQVAEWGGLAAAVLVLALPLRGGLGVPLLLLALLLPRVPLFDRWVPVADPASFYAETDATRFVAGRLAEEGPRGFRVAGAGGSLVPHSAAFFGFEEVRVYDPMTFAPYADFLLAFGPAPPFGWIGTEDPRHPALAFLGARWYFAPPGAPGLGGAGGVGRAYRGADATVYEAPRALPRLFVPRRVEVHPDAAAAVAAARAIDDFAARATAVAAPGAGLAAGTTVANPPARVEDLVVAGRRIRARVVAPAAALVASSQPAIPGWRVEVDGRRVEPLSIHGAFLGVAVPAGEHRVEMVYAPVSWRVGLGLAGLGVVLGALLVDRGRRRERG